jgi:tetratricopeptide (TPR) repeat protein
VKPWKAFLGVAAITFAVYLPSLGSDFVRWDDDRNFVENPAWRGLGASNLSWMFTRFHMGHYQPLSWVTLGLDYAVGGMNPRGYHLTNAFLHALAAGTFALLAASLLARGMPGLARASWLGAVVALFWALHPLRVEAVSWVTQRREVLCGLLTLLAIGSRDRGRPWWVTGLLALAAMLAKVTAVTIPFMLVLLDLWKERLGGHPLQGRAVARAAGRHAHLFLLAGVFVGVSIMAQRKTGAMVSTDLLPLTSRVALYGFGAAFAVAKTIWPSGLAPLHQGQTGTTTWDLQPFVWWVAAGGLVLVAGAIALGWRRRLARPGWLALALAFAILVLPAGGLGQSGPQIAADRYSYQPGWVLSLAAGALAARFLGSARSARQESRAPRRTVAPSDGPGPRSDAVAAGRAELAAGVVLLALAALTVRQQSFWKSSDSLWARQVAVYPESPVGNYHLGLLLSGGRPPDLAAAEARFRTALASDPEYVEARCALGELLRVTGRRNEAIEMFAPLLIRRPAAMPAAAWRLGGMLFWEGGKKDEAVAAFTKLVEVEPGSPVAWRQLGKIQAAAGRPREAIATWERGLAAAPDDALRNELAWLLATHPDAALRDGRRALDLAEKIVLRDSTRFGRAATLAAARAESGDFDGAAREIEAVLPDAPPGRAPGLQTILADLKQRRPVRVEPVFP